MTAFSIGYLSHLGADARFPVLEGEFYYLGFLAWPVIPPIEYATDQSLFAHLQGIELTSFFVFELVLVVLAFGFWIQDDTPGLHIVKSAPVRAYRKLLIGK